MVRSWQEIDFIQIIQMNRLLTEVGARMREQKGLLRHSETSSSRKPLSFLRLKRTKGGIVCPEPQRAGRGKRWAWRGRKQGHYGVEGHS